MKRIQLSQGKSAMVDDSDYDWLMQWKWYAHKRSGIYYAHGKSRSMHRLIMGITDPNILIDHINHDGLDNQRHNLRVATKKQNSSNRRAKKNGSSKFLGVNIKTIQRTNKHGVTNVFVSWQVKICHNKKRIHIGEFKNEEKAARAYDEAAKKYHGEFANLNFK